MELGLGLKTYFCLETRDPIFLNFRLSAEEIAKVRGALPPGFRLEPIRFSDEHSQPDFWVSFNLYHIRYPKPELAGVRRARCEINTFVTDAQGRKGVYVFSPLVSKEDRPSAIGRLCELAERTVLWIYGCGKLLPLVYETTGGRVHVAFDEAAHGASANYGMNGTAERRLSEEYVAFNDISFFNGGKTFDQVNVDSRFALARFQRLEGDGAPVRSPFFNRAPDEILFHRGNISYLVDALNPV